MQLTEPISNQLHKAGNKKEDGSKPTLRAMARVALSTPSMCAELGRGAAPYVAGLPGPNTLTDAQFQVTIPHVAPPVTTQPR